VSRHNTTKNLLAAQEEQLGDVAETQWKAAVGQSYLYLNCQWRKQWGQGVWCKNTDQSRGFPISWEKLAWVTSQRFCRGRGRGFEVLLKGGKTGQGGNFALGQIQQ